MNRAKRRGFTLIEMLIVVTVMGAMAGMAVPRIRDMLLKESVRGARRSIATHIQKARGTAAARGCSAAMHVSTGAAARAWVTTCQVSGTGVDTVSMDDLSDDYGVYLAAFPDSLVFAPTGYTTIKAWSIYIVWRDEAIDFIQATPLGTPISF